MAGERDRLHHTIIVLGVGIGVMLPMWRMARSSSLRPASDLWWRMLVLLVVETLQMMEVLSKGAICGSSQNKLDF
jgi:hypothetical protein